MQYMKSYYVIEASLRYYGRLPAATEVIGGHVFGTLGSERADATRWKEAPHERLANLQTYDTRAARLVLTTKPVSGVGDPKAIEAFVRKHGVLLGRVNENTGHFDEDAVRFARAQDSLRRAWSGEGAAIKEFEEQVEDALEAHLSVRAGGIEIATENLWSFICVLFLRDHVARKTKVCQNPDCSNPYFLQQRRGQKYCSHKCAVLMNVRRFRERQANANLDRKRRTKR